MAENDITTEELGAIVEPSVNDKIKNALNLYTPLLRTNFKKTFVSLQSGKGLSTEDFTTALKNKLNSLTSGDENVIESITFNGEAVSIDNKNAIINYSVDSGDENVIESITFNGAQVSIDNKNAIINYSVESGDENVIESITFNGTQVSIDNKNAIINYSVEGGEDNVIESITFNGAQVSIDNKNAIINYSVDSGDKNVIESITFNGTQVSIDNKNAIINYSVDSGDKNVIESITFNGEAVSIDNKNAAINYSVEGGEVNQLNGVSIGGAECEFDTTTKIATFTLPEYANQTLESAFNDLLDDYTTLKEKFYVLYNDYYAETTIVQEVSGFKSGVWKVYNALGDDLTVTPNNDTPEYHSIEQTADGWIFA